MGTVGMSANRPDGGGVTKRLELTDGQLATLQNIFYSWVGEGFTTPPYQPEVYDLFEMVGLEKYAGMDYDIERPHQEEPP